MKKGLILGMFSASLMLASCGGIGGGTTTQGNQGNGSMLGSGVGESVGNIISSIIGGGKLSKENLYGTWRYDGPGCAFTSENLLARGLDVAVVELADQVLAPLDPEMAAVVERRLVERGVTVRTGVGIEAVGTDDVTLSDGTSGTAHGVGEDGALLVHTAGGMQAITSSEVSVRPSAVQPV